MSFPISAKYEVPLTARGKFKAFADSYMVSINKHFTVNCKKKALERPCDGYDRPCFSSTEGIDVNCQVTVNI